MSVARSVGLAPAPRQRRPSLPLLDKNDVDAEEENRFAIPAGTDFSAMVTKDVLVPAGITKRFSSSASASFLSRKAIMASSAREGGSGGNDNRPCHADSKDSRIYSPLPTLP